ncbi:hypothetical protein LINPERHAP1_LOCUS2084, partial [Linum perenne]
AFCFRSERLIGFAETDLHLALAECTAGFGENRALVSPKLKVRMAYFRLELD